LRAILEPEDVDDFVEIEPESGKMLSEATQGARRAYPHRLTHAMRVGHWTALHFEMHVR
jgi:hypothetical protein